MIHLLLEHYLPGNYGYQNPLFRAVLAILVGFIIVWALGPKVIKTLIHKKLGDIPDFDHKALNELTKDKSNIPTMGGVLILFGILCSTLLMARLKVYYIHVAMVCLVWLGALGFIDDWFKLRQKSRGGSRDGLKFYQKLLFQIGLGVMLGIFVYKRGMLTFENVDNHNLEHYRVFTIPFLKGTPEHQYGILLTPAAFYIITVLVVAGTSNAVNLTDGMDGLASGCVALCCFVFMLLSYAVGDERLAEYLYFPYIPDAGELAVLCGAMMGTCLGFLWYNCHPAQVFMGDTGSLPLGGLIGFVAIVIRQELMLLIVGGVFVMEALSVILQVGYFKATKARFGQGRRLFLIAPVHHHFQMKGWPESRVVVRFWLLAVLFAALALASTKIR